MSTAVKHMTRPERFEVTPVPHSRIHQLHKQFPPREFELWWPHTAASAEAVEARLNCSVLAEAAVTTRAGRHRGVIKILTWLASVPGDTWQARWLASGAENIRGSRYGATASWADLPVEWIAGHGRPVRHDRNDLAAGLLMLLCLDVIRPQLSWMLSRAHPFLAPMMAKLRDPDGFARLDELAATQPDTSRDDARIAATRIATLLVSKGGTVAEITVGDCVELIDTMAQVHSRRGQKKIDFYLRLRAMGIFPEDAPHSIRAFGAPVGQLTIEQLVDRYPIENQPIRDLLIDYLRERQPALDYTSLNSRARGLAGLFWSRVETLAPGIDTLHLPPDVARAWKDDLRSITRTAVDAAGRKHETTSPRKNYKDNLLQVRAFYLDLAHWAVEDPSRWAQWVAPCPISDGEVKEARNSNTAKRGWTNAPASGCLSCLSWFGPPLTAARPQRHYSLRRRTPNQVR